MAQLSLATRRPKAVGLLLGVPILILIAIASNYIEKIPLVKYYGIEFVVWAVLIGIVVGNLVKLPEVLKAAFRSEFFIKTGVVLLGASVNFSVLLSLGAKGAVQAAIVVTSVFLFALLLGTKLGLDRKMGAVLASGVSICGVSASIAAAGAVLAKKEHLTYVISLVVAFAMPLMLIQPLLARLLSLPDSVAGAWIGGNIDTTAAVVAAGSLFSKEAMKVASVVKMSQNVLIGVVAFLLSLYYALYMGRHRDPSNPEVVSRPSPIVIWQRFPKFVLGFILVSVLLSAGFITKDHTATIDAARRWFFAMAFASIGLGFSLNGFRSVGGKPLLVFFLATVFNLILAYTLAWLIFGGILWP